MKLKFDSEILNVINIIASLPEEVNDIESRKNAARPVRDLETKIKYQLENKQIPSKHHAKIRRQVSYLWEILYMERILELRRHGIESTSISTSNSNVDENRIYKNFIARIKTIKSQEALKSFDMIKMSLKYGVLFLSDHEIEGLIERNEV